MTKVYTKKERGDINKRRQELIDAGKIKENLEGLTDEEALAYILPTVGFDDDEAAFVLAIERGGVELAAENGIVI